MLIFHLLTWYLGSSAECGRAEGRRISNATFLDNDIDGRIVPQAINGLLSMAACVDVQ